VVVVVVVVVVMAVSGCSPPPLRAGQVCGWRGRRCHPEHSAQVQGTHPSAEGAGGGGITPLYCSHMSRLTWAATSICILSL